MNKVVHIINNDKICIEDIPTRGTFEIERLDEITIITIIDAGNI